MKLESGSMYVYTFLTNKPILILMFVSVSVGEFQAGPGSGGGWCQCQVLLFGTQQGQTF